MLGNIYFMNEDLSKYHVSTYNKDSVCELGLPKHSGMVLQVFNDDINTWLDRELRFKQVKTCIMGEDPTVKFTTTSIGNEHCDYISDITIGNYGKLDVMLCNFVMSNLNHDRVKSSIYNHIVLALHTAAYNRVTNLIVNNVGCGLIDEDLYWFTDVFKKMTGLYKCYLCNVYYLMVDAGKYKICKDIIERR